MASRDLGPWKTVYPCMVHTQILSTCHQALWEHHMWFGTLGALEQLELGKVGYNDWKIGCNRLSLEESPGIGKCNEN